MTKLYIANGPEKGRSWELQPEKTSVGRSPENHIQIRDKSVSRRHLEIINRNNRFFIVDLKSTNGTFVNGKPIDPGREFQVKAGTAISLGNIFISLGETCSGEALSVQDAIDVSNDLSETGVFDRPMTSPKNLELIYKVSSVLMQSLNINEILEKALNYIFELLQRIDRGAIILVDSGSGRIMDVISRSAENSDKTMMMYSRSLVSKVIRERKALIVTDTEKDQEIHPSESMEIMKIRSVMCVPLISRDQIRGVLYVDSVSKPYGFRKEDLSLLMALSSPAAMAIENALLYSRLEDLVQERTKSLKDAEQKLRESEARFKGIFDHMSNGVVVYRAVNGGEDFSVLDLNRADERIEKIAKGDALGRKAVDLFPEMRELGILDVLKRVWETGYPERSSVALIQEEKLVWWREYFVYRLESGEIVSIFNDITERKKAEQEQKTLQKQLLVSQKMESIGAFAGGTAHNFRNILQAISGNIEYLEMLFGDRAEVKDVAKSVFDSVEKGVDLINNLLHFSRRGESYEFVDLDLVEVARRACDIIERVFDKSIEIRINLEQGLYMRGNPSLLSQVFMNLFTNARDAMPNGGTLTIEAKRLGNQVMASVSDTGIGMAPEVVEKIFDPFFSLKDVGKGTGLGLSTTHGIVEEHKGFIRVFSRPDRGTTFRIFFPYCEPEYLKSEETEEEMIRGKGQKVLIVDDELPSLEALVNLTRGLGYKAISAGSAMEAVRNYRQWAPDVVLMDRNMPEMDGIACIKEIMRHDPEARILIVSGYEQDGPNGIDQDIKSLIKGYLTKPCGMKDLSRGLSQALSV